jgi:hypothetical protein
MFVYVGEQQLAATLSSHHAHLFKVALTDSEISVFEAKEASGKPCGEANTAEKCYVEVRTVRQIVGKGLVDWSMLGMICSSGLI